MRVLGSPGESWGGGVLGRGSPGQEESSPGERGSGSPRDEADLL